MILGCSWKLRVRKCEKTLRKNEGKSVKEQGSSRQNISIGVAIKILMIAGGREARTWN